MTSPRRPNDPEAGEAQPAEETRKKAYTPPSFVREQVFETMALACGKVNTTIAQCRSVKKNS